MIYRNDYYYFFFIKKNLFLKRSKSSVDSFEFARCALEFRNCDQRISTRFNQKSLVSKRKEITVLSIPYECTISNIKIRILAEDSCNVHNTSRRNQNLNRIERD